MNKGDALKLLWTVQDSFMSKYNKLCHNNDNFVKRIFVDRATFLHQLVPIYVCNMYICHFSKQTRNLFQTEIGSGLFSYFKASFHFILSLYLGNYIPFDRKVHNDG